ncbi:MAG: nucleotidyltransferase family protein [Pseudorhodobacter sp.]|nr:nucleotidyltransferase family protein [Frankiaceae bacterium]
MINRADAARALAQDSALLEVAAVLHADAVPYLLLKGRASADLLGTSVYRLSSDVDLLVPPGRYGQARRVLSCLDYQDVLGAARPHEQMTFESTWRRGVATVDLHRTLHGVVDGELVWAVFSETPDTVVVGGQEFRCGNRAVRLFHLALHLAQSTGHSEARTRQELAHAVSLLPVTAFERALVVADRLGARDLFTVALQRAGAGALCAELGLDGRPGSDRAAAVLAGRSLTVHAVERLSTLPWVERPAFVLRQLTPSRAIIGQHLPPGRRRRGALAGAYVRRLQVGAGRTVRLLRDRRDAGGAAR